MRLQSLPILLLGAAAVMMLMAGCNSSTGGTGNPTPSTGASATGSSSANGGPADHAPKVTSPLNTTKVVANPCSALTSADLDSLKLAGAQTRPHNIAGGVGCEWHIASTGVSDGVLWPAVTAGLNDAYTAHAEGSSSGVYWKPTTVDGYPAVWDEEPDQRQSGDCTISVGANDQRYFLVEYQMATASDSQANATQSCSMAQQTASAVLKNLKASGGS